MVCREFRSFLHVWGTNARIAKIRAVNLRLALGQA